MIKKRGGSGSAGELAEILKDLLITQLGMAGVAQQSIRQIVGCDINRVNRIVKHLKAAKRKDGDYLSADAPRPPTRRGD